MGSPGYERPGRFDRHIHVSAPDAAARRGISEIHAEDKPLVPDVDLDELTARTERYVGVDIEVICREAATIAVRERIEARKAGEAVGGDEFELTMEHFDRAVLEVDPGTRDGERRFEWRADLIGTDVD